MWVILLLQTKIRMAMHLLRDVPEVQMCLYSQELNIKKAGNLEAQLCFSFQKKAVYTVPL